MTSNKNIIILERIRLFKFFKLLSNPKYVCTFLSFCLACLRFSSTLLVNSNSCSIMCVSKLLEILQWEATFAAVVVMALHFHCSPTAPTNVSNQLLPPPPPLLLPPPPSLYPPHVCLPVFLPLLPAATSSRRWWAHLHPLTLAGENHRKKGRMGTERQRGEGSWLS